jgi:chromosomal replication initiation ATPase DnaA
MGQEEDNNQKIMDIEDLVEKISRYYGVEAEEIVDTRKKNVREARSVLVYLASKYLNETGVKIGEFWLVSI